MLGTKSGYGKLLKNNFSDIILCDCVNHRLEVAVGNAIKIIKIPMIFSHFFSIYIYCTTSHQKITENLANVLMIRNDPQKNRKGVFCLLGCFIFQGSISSTIWHSFTAFAQYFHTASNDKARQITEKATSRIII